MVSVNTVEKYTDVYAAYKKSKQELKALEYCLKSLECNLVEADLYKLISVVPKAELERLTRRVESRGSSDLPWL